MARRSLAAGQPSAAGRLQQRRPVLRPRQGSPLTCLNAGPTGPAWSSWNGTSMRSSKLDPRCNPAPTRRQQAALVVAGGDRAPGGEALIQVDIDATVVRAHSEKEQAAPTWNKTFGIHPL